MSHINNIRKIFIIFLVPYPEWLSYQRKHMSIDSLSSKPQAMVCFTIKEFATVARLGLGKTGLDIFFKDDHDERVVRIPSLESGSALVAAQKL